MSDVRSDRHDRFDEPTRILATIANESAMTHADPVKPAPGMDGGIQLACASGT